MKSKLKARLEELEPHYRGAAYRKAYEYLLTDDRLTKVHNDPIYNLGANINFIFERDGKFPSDSKIKEMAEDIIDCM